MSVIVTHDSSHYRQLLMERVPSMLAYWDADLRCQFANRAYERWFGVSPSSLLGTSLRDLLGRELFALNEPHIRAALAGHEQTFERVVPGPGGVQRDSLAHYIPDIVDGVVVGFLVQVNDVTSLKAAQVALEHSKEYLQELLSLTTEAVLVADREGRYIDLNDACSDMLGYSREQMLGKTFEDLLCAQEVDRLPAARARLLSGERHVEEWALRRKDGSTVPVEVRASSLPDGRRVGYLRDITEHKRALAAERDMAAELERRVQDRTLELEHANRDLQRSHDALEASERRYHALVDWSPQAIVVHREGRVVYVNRSALELFRAASEGELLGKPILEMIRPEFRGFVMELAARTVEQGAAGPAADVGLVRLDGSPIETEVQAIPIVYEGEAAYMAAIRDISAAKQAEDSLRRSEARQRAIFESATDAILTADEAQTIATANSAAAAMFRCSQDELIGSPLERFMPERFRAGHRHDMDEFGGAAVNSRHMGRARDVMGLRSDGEEFPIDVSISHLNLDGKPLYTAILRDITERRRIEGELRSGKATLEAALSSMSDAVCISDVHGRFLSFNHAFATFHRFSSIDDCRTTLADYLPLLDVFMADGKPVPLDQWAVPSALRGETASGVEYRLRRKDTGQTWVGSYSFAPVRSENGAIVGAVVAARDVTELKQRQTELESAHADLQRLIAAKDKVQEEERKRIARDLHDDLQQTLSAIRIDVGVIDQTFAADPVAVAPMLAKVDELASAAIMSARRIVNDLQPQVLEDLGLVPALEALATQFSQRTGITCQLEALDASLASSSIETSLYRIAQEALNNVVKHAQASAVHLRLTMAAGANLVLRVSDNGKGMSVSDRKKAQSFGLLGMQQRVRALGGALRIESQLGAGTAIEVVVPLPGPQRALHADAIVLEPDTTSASGRMPLAPDELDRATADAGGPVGSAGASVQETIDAMPGNIAILDFQGVIRFVNRAWREFAEHNGDPGMIASGPEVNYLAVCRRSAQEDEQAGQVLKGLIEVLEGSRDEFVTAYPCHSPHEQRWFLVRVAPTVGGNVQVTHLDVSHLADVVRPSVPPGAVP